MWNERDVIKTKSEEIAKWCFMMLNIWGNYLYSEFNHPREKNKIHQSDTQYMQLGLKSMKPGVKFSRTFSKIYLEINIVQIPNAAMIL